MIQTIPGGLWIPPSWMDTASIPAFLATAAMNTAARFEAAVFQVPKSGTLDQFEWRQGANTNAPDNGFRFSFQDVTTLGAPDNTEDQFALVTTVGTGVWLVPNNVMTNDGTPGGVKRVVTKGDWLACVMRFESFVAGDSITMTGVGCGGSNFSQIAPALAYMLTTSNSGTAWSKSNVLGLPALALKYDDGTYAVLEWPFIPALNLNTLTFNNGSTPDERGLLFQVPFPCRLSGAWVRIDVDNPVDIVLYNAADTIIASASLVAGRRVQNNSLNTRVNFVTPVTLTPNVNYRLTVLPTSASSVIIYDFDTATSAIRESIDGGATWMSTQRTNAGAWTNVNTNRPFMGIILDGFDDAAIGGSGEHSSVF